MHSPALAVAWEFRQRHRVALAALAIYALAFATIRLLVLGPADPIELDPPNGIAGALIAPVSSTFLYFLAVFSYGLGGDMAARASIFPARMFTLPVTTRALVGWPMLYGGAAMASLWLVVASFVRWSWGLELPLVWPAVLAAVWLAWTQVLAWTGYGLPGLRIVAAVLWLAALDVVVILAVQLQVPEPWIAAMLVPQLPLAYLAACRAVAKARRGDVPDWRGAIGRLARLAQLPSPRLRRFSSPAEAQVWMEWRQRGHVLPALVGMALPFELALLYLASDEPAVLVFLTLAAVLVTPPFLAGFTAAFEGDQAARDGSGASGTTLTATRPMTSAALVAAKLRAALRSTLVAWALVLAAVPLALALTGSWPVVREHAADFVAAFGKPRATALALLVVAGLLASTWKQLVQSLYIALAGRAWVVRTSVLLRLSLLVVLGLLVDWVVGNARVQRALWNGWPVILAVLVGLKMAAAAWIVPRLRRSRLLEDDHLVRGAALWSAAVLALYGLFVWLACTPEFIPRYVAALVAILAVPLVRLSAAPLALASSRHRGAPRRAGSEPGSGRKSRRLVAVAALLALPAVLYVAEATSYRVRHRNNGRLVSSGQLREYLLYVPKSYDPARPTPLVISMHGAGGWPAQQRDISRWNERAEAEGLIVVYPSGLSGQPRVWRADGSPKLADDVRFISDLIDSLSATYNVDEARVYADGLSNGGGMAFALSCTLADRIAAVGMVASAQLLPFEWCPDRRAVPVIAVHGTADRLTPYHGGKTWVARREFPDIPEWMAHWARRNGCRPDAVESAAAADVTRLEYRGCAGDASVVLYTVKDGGHTWPGGRPIPKWLAGTTSRSIDATREMWSFYRAHPRLHVR